MSTYAKHFSTRQTPQTQPIPGSTQVANSGGGFSWAVDRWTRLNRFLILGNEGGSYYASEQKMTLENATAVQECFRADPARTIQTIVSVSDGGRAPKNDPAVFALAICFGEAKNAQPVSDLLKDALPKVCRIGTHLFQFAEAVQNFRGWGRLLCRSIGNWYTSKDVSDVCLQLVKYQSRNKWSHRDVLRLAHVKPPNDLYSMAFKWAVAKDKEVEVPAVPDLNFITGFERIKKAGSPNVAASLIREFSLPRECVPTEMLTKPEVWEALLEKMPMTALVRNLATMTKIGLLAPLSTGTGEVLKKLADPTVIRKSRLHPIAVLTALLTYKGGRSIRGDSHWTPVTQIVDALDGAFYQSFGNVEPCNKRMMLALDVSGSMSVGEIAGVCGLTPRVASSAMAMVTAAVEPLHCFMAFSQNFIPLSISPRQRLDDICMATERLPFSQTDCALPMLHAMQTGIEVDAFVIYTDSETNCNSMHPSQALQRYREKTGINAKLIVVGMVANRVSIADPNDTGMMDVVGFDTATPNVMTDFIKE